MRRLMMQKNGGEPSISFPTIFKVEDIETNSEKETYIISPSISNDKSFVLKVVFSIPETITTGYIFSIERQPLSGMYIGDGFLDINILTRQRLRVNAYLSNNISITTDDYSVKTNAVYYYEFFYDAKNKTEKITLHSDVGGVIEYIVDAKYDYEVPNYQYDDISLGGKRTNIIKTKVVFHKFEIQQES